MTLKVQFPIGFHRLTRRQKEDREYHSFNVYERKKCMASRILVVALILILSIAYVILYAISGIGMPCFLYETTGLFCPGCGLTRMVFALLRLDLYEAFRMNPLMLILLPFFTVFMTYAVYCYIADKPNNMAKKIPKWVYAVIILSVLLFGILRNMPVFSFMAPV
ncbi:MAG: DUF2752 domain-containing protein [Ruminococcaceae bacterium]|nr:DUF2752 domain-containing protein [Oscillospiraceae bacterium]